MGDITIATQHLKQKISQITTKPGVYRFLDAANNALYVGKAKNLKKRLSAYTMTNKLNQRLRHMICQACNIGIIITDNESQALILEAALIKNQQPKYNVLLRDDKSYPYIIFNKNHPYPRIAKYRGSRTKNNSYFGPFTSAAHAMQLIAVIQKMFKIRICSDAEFSARNRPCLEHYMNRCSAPCVKLISADEYQAEVKRAMEFLGGKAIETKELLRRQMLEASNKMQYELANEYKNTIIAIDNIYNNQNNATVSPNIPDADFIAIKFLEGFYCIHVFFFRRQQNTGHCVFSSEKSWEENISDILATFILQFYQEYAPPKTIYTNIQIPDILALEQALSSIAAAKHHSQLRTTIRCPQRGEALQTMGFVDNNATESLQKILSERFSNQRILQMLAVDFNLPKTPELIEACDNSHNFGDCPVGVMIVANQKGFVKSSYKKFNLQNTVGNDYAMLEEMLRRRLRSLSKTDDEQKPDLLLIDGGPGHASAAEKIMRDTGVFIPFICIAKGPKRNAGMEKFYTTNNKAYSIANKEVLRYLQRLRDEAHRFAISTHRKKKQTKMVASELDAAPGIGPTRKKNLLQHFQSIASLKQASLEEITAAPGIGAKRAAQLYLFLHPDGDTTDSR